MRKMNPLELKAHVLNYRLYGKEKPDPELVESIQKHGVLEPLTILKDGTIISVVIVVGEQPWPVSLCLRIFRVKLLVYADDFENRKL